jgi:hypothetical protein
LLLFACGQVPDQDARLGRHGAVRIGSHYDLAHGECWCHRQLKARKASDSVRAQSGAVPGHHGRRRRWCSSSTHLCTIRAGCLHDGTMRSVR